MIKNRRNKGLTLVEILIAISVFTVVMGMIGLSVSTIKRGNFKKATEKLQSVISTARTQTMAKGEVAGAFLVNTRADGSVWAKISNTEETFICNKGITVSFVSSYNGPNVVNPVNASMLTFTTSGAIDWGALGDTGGKYYLQSKDGKLRAEVIIYPFTGKTAVKYL